jgi:hypothetical protein
MTIGIPPAEPAGIVQDRRAAEAEALTNDTIAGVERAVRVWNKVHDPRKSSLSAGEHSIAVLQGMVICAGQQAAALTIVNPGSSHEWLRSVLVDALGKAFDDVREAAALPVASPTEQ